MLQRLTQLAACAAMIGAIAALGTSLPANAAAKKPAAHKPAAGANAAWAKSFFAQNCAACHGANGTGGVGPNLHGVAKKGSAFITNRIKNGSPKGMPPFGTRLKPDQIKAMVTFVETTFKK